MDNSAINDFSAIEEFYGKKIDIHTHLIPGVMDAEKRMEANRLLGIAKCVILSTGGKGSGLLSFTPEQAFEVAGTYPENFTWLCNVVPDGTTETDKLLHRYKKMGAAGVGEFTCGMRLDSPVMDRLFDCLAELNLPFLFHMTPEASPQGYGVVDDPGLPGLEHALRNHPNLIIIGHSQPFWYEMSQYDDPSAKARNGYPTGKVKEGRVCALLRDYPNLYCDLSANSGGGALLRDTEYSVSFMNEFQDRLMFGTDWLGGVMRYPLGPWLDYMLISEQLTRDVYRKICYDNANRLFF